MKRLGIVTALTFGIVATACGGGSSSSSPTPTQPPPTASAVPADTQDAPATAATAGALADLVSSADIESVLGEPAPTPECVHTNLTQSDSCTWTAAPGDVSLQVERSTSFETIDEWRDAWTGVGMDEVVEGIGVGALAGDNPFGGVRIAAYTDDAVSYAVVLTSNADRAALMALAQQILASVVAAAG
jgi:hypothetical protein